MPGVEDYVGEILDEKYRLELLLGKGGMGAVYLATHLGTERYVALKLISPQFMRNNEFVERFKREARAAGRLRHPNVVDVTDFGFADVKAGQVAYLVMEYLDGCTLGDVLSEEKRLPLEWVADIMDQVCSAVQEAHQQGIIHRDLKPDNIWLEPNRLGSYRVKVLDFGIAKLGEAGGPELDEDAGAATIIDEIAAIAPFVPQLESDTLLRPGVDEGVGTLLKSPVPDKSNNHTHQTADDDGTLLFEPGTQASARQTMHHTTVEEGAALTRVGAIMGTPLYMSPEQCGGGHVDTRSDIYSLGVIAYQMLAGEPPFAGNTSAVMRAHREQSPKHLVEHETKIPKRVAGVVMSALAKDPAQRPPTAFAFSSAIRGQSEGIGALYRRAFSLYSEYFPKFAKLTLIAHIPIVISILFMAGLVIFDKYRPPESLGMKVAMVVALVIVEISHVVAYTIAGAVISGVTAVIITQLTAAPLRPVKLRVAFAVLRRRWRPFLKTMLLVTLRVFLFGCLCIIPGIVAWMRYILYAPVVLLEGLEKKAAMKRARQLASRSWRTMIIASLLQLLIPMTVGIVVGQIKINGAKPDSLEHQLYQQIFSLANIFIMPLISIVPALLYLKMRQLGGEPLTPALLQIEEGETHSAWQQRMRTRLSLHTPTGQKTTGSRTTDGID